MRGINLWHFVEVSFIKFTPLTCISSRGGSASSKMASTSTYGPALDEASIYIYIYMSVVLPMPSCCSKSACLLSNNAFLKMRKWIEPTSSGCKTLLDIAAKTFFFLTLIIWLASGKHFFRSTPMSKAHCMVVCVCVYSYHTVHYWILWEILANQSYKTYTVLTPDTVGD